MASLQASDFQTRQDLDKEVGRVFGATTDTKTGSEITGTQEELRRLQLKHGHTVWGVVCRATDLPKKKNKVFAKPDRGDKAEKFGLNINN